MVRSEEDGITLRELTSRLGRHRRLILGVTAGVVLATAAWTFLSTPRYRSTAVVRVLEQESGLDLLTQVGSVPGLDLGSLTEDDLNTEVGVLRSRRIHSAVVDSLGLRVRLTRPRGERSRLLRVLSPGPAELEGEITLRRRDDGSYDVEIDDFDPPLSVPETVRPGEPFRVGSLVLELTGASADDPADRIDLEVVPRYEAVDDLQDDVRIQRQEGGSRLVEVSYDHPDRHLAAAVVNGLVGEYLEYKRTTERGETRSRAEDLRDEIAEHLARLSEAEEALREFQQRNRVLAPEEEATQQVRRVAELQIAMDRLRVERAAVADLLELVEGRAAGEDGPAAFRQLATLPSLISNAAIQDMLENLVELENERSLLLTLRQPGNVDVRQLGARIGELENQLHRVASSYLESLEGQLASTGGELARLNQELEAMPALEMEYLRRYRDRTLLDETYVLLETQLKQAEIQEAIHDVGVRVVDDGEVPHPDDPVFPKPAVHLLLALLLGLTAGTGGALARDMWDSRIHSRDDVLAAAPGLHVVATLPKLQPAGRLEGGGRRFARLGGRTDGARAQPAVDRDPWSPAAEAYRGLATSLSFQNGTEPLRVLVVTSPDDGEGKTTVSSNLAAALAQQGLRTILVDGDLRAGSLHRSLGATESPGLTGVLAGQASVEEAVRTVELSGSARSLDVLPAGDPLRRPLDGPGMEALTGVLARLGERYDRVVIDGPAVERGAHVLALGRQADAVVLVARRGRTDRHALARAAERIRTSGADAPLLVMNEGAGPEGRSA